MSTGTANTLAWTKNEDGTHFAVGTNGGYLASPKGGRFTLVFAPADGDETELAKRVSLKEARVTAETHNAFEVAPEAPEPEELPEPTNVYNAAGAGGTGREVETVTVVKYTETTEPEHTITETVVRENEPLPEVRKDRQGTRVIAASANPKAVKVILAKDHTLEQLAAWAEGVRDVYEKEGKLLTITALIAFTAGMPNVDRVRFDQISEELKTIYHEEHEREEYARKELVRTRGRETSPEERAAKAPKEPVVTSKVLVQNETQTVTEGKKGGKRFSLYGFAVTAVLRWMGKDAWTFADARKCMDKLNLEVADATLRAQLRAGVKGERGDPAALTESQVEALYAAAETETPAA